MRQIYKYSLLDDFGQPLTDFPEGDVMTVAFQRGWPCVWINHEQDTIHRMTLASVTTGEFFDDVCMRHVGSCVSDTLVLHIFRRY